MAPQHDQLLAGIPLTRESNLLIPNYRDRRPRINWLLDTGYWILDTEILGSEILGSEILSPGSQISQILVII